jgi:HK97 gp10 family phage protein
MPVKVTVPIGIAKLDAKFSRFREDVADAVNEANEGLRDVAQQLAPVSTDGSHGRSPGFLRDNIVITKEAAPGDTNAATESQAEYSAATEYGFHHWQDDEFVDPQPFMSPAFELAKEQLKRAIRAIFTS